MKLLCSLCFFAVIVNFVFCINASADDGSRRPAYYARKIIDRDIVSAAESYLHNECATGRASDEDCAPSAALLIVYYFEKKQYRQIDPLLEAFRAYKVRASEGSPCPATGFVFRGIIYDFAYFQGSYQIYTVTNPAKAAKYLLRAFICESVFSRGYTVANEDNRILKEGLGLDEFTNAVKATFGSSARYDAKFFVEKIARPMMLKYDKIRGGHRWNVDLKKDVRDGLAIATLIKNAEKFCRSTDLDEQFCGFLKDYAFWIENGVRGRSQRM